MTCEEPDVCGICQKFICACSRTPRVAESVDDLRADQIITWQSSDGSWNCPGHVTDPGSWRESLPVVILSDPPPEPVRVPADLIDALAEAVRIGPYSRLDVAARAVVDAARNGTDR